MVEIILVARITGGPRVKAHDCDETLNEYI